MEFKNTEEKIDITTECGVQKGLQLKYQKMVMF